MLNKKNNYTALLFFSVVGAVILSPVLFFGKVFFGSDITQGLYPFVQFISNTISEGGSLLWSSQIFSGFPLYVLGNFFNPFFSLLYFFSAFTVYHWLILANIVFAGFFTFLFIKKLDLGFWPAIFGGLTYIIATFNWVADLSLASALPVLPLLLFLIFLYYKRPAIWKFALVSFVIGYAIYSVNFNILPIIICGVFLYTVFLSWTERIKTIKNILTLSGTFILMVIGGIVIGLPQLLPTAIISSLSARAGGLSFTEASVDAFSVFDFTKLFLPYFELPLGVSSNYFYLGALPLFFLFFSLFVKKTAQYKFFLALLLGSFLVAVKYSPIFWIMTKLPLLDSLRVPGRWLFLLFFSASILTAYGLAGFLSEEAKTLRQRALLIYKNLLAVVLSVLAVLSFVLYVFRGKFISLTQDYFIENRYQKTTGLSLEYYFEVISGYYDSMMNSVSIWLPAVFLPVGFCVLAFILLRFFQKQSDKTKLILPIIIFTALNFIAVLWMYHPTVSNAIFLKPSKTVEFLQEHEGKYMSFLPGATEYQKLTIPFDPNTEDIIKFQNSMLPPNLSFIYGLSGADYYNNLMSRRMSRLLAFVGSDRATTGEKLSEEKLSPEQKARKLGQRQKVLDLLGVRYVISAYPLLESRLGKVLETSATRFDIPVYIYENQSLRPLVYLADNSVIIRPSEEESYNLTSTLDLKERDIVVECPNKCLVTTGGAQGTVEVIEKKNGYWEILVETHDDRWLVVSENLLPGWQAKIDGEKAPLYYVNSTFIGVPVQSGKHEIKFKYFNIWQNEIKLIE